ncbi:MAG: hypothetical protein IT422_27355 [Pirellulaceae bacterium]|nr:hypothetical protein [Pirellulaceae bacterium]
MRGIGSVVICLLLTVGGGVAGLGYLTYCLFFSGELIGQYQWSTGHACEFELTPDMSPVRVVAGVMFVVPRGQYSRRFAVYDGTLRCGNETIWSGQFGPSIDDNDISTSSPLGEEFRVTKNYVLPSFDVPESATYSFLADESFEVDLKVVGRPLSVLSNVVEPVISVVVIGCLTMGLGILGLVYFGIRAIRQSIC